MTLNLHPASGVQPFEEAYPAMARAMGQDPSEQKYLPLRITDRKFVNNYFSLLHRAPTYRHRLRPPALL